MAQIRITMGGCQDFGVAGIIRATGARGQGNGSRAFVIDGPMTVEQVAALEALSLLDSADDPVMVEFDPVGLVDDYTADDEDGDLHDWWVEQVYGEK